MTLTRTHKIGIAAGVALACALAWKFAPRAKTVTTTMDTAVEAKTDVQGTVTTTTERGPITVHRKVTTPTPQGPRVEETTVSKAPVQTTQTTSVVAQTTEKVRVETKTVTVEKPASWYRFYGEAGWKVGLELDPKPSEVELGAQVRPLPVPLWLGVSGRADPERISEGTLNLTLRAEWP